LKFSGLIDINVTGQTIFFLPDSGNANQILAANPGQLVRLDYPISEATTVTSFAAYITTVVPTGGSATFNLRVNNFIIASITFAPTEGFPTAKFIAVPNIPVAAGDLITVELVTDGFTGSSQANFIASASCGLT
jgi:hypothetical protein